MKTREANPRSTFGGSGTLGPGAVSAIASPIGTETQVAKNRKRPPTLGRITPRVALRSRIRSRDSARRQPITAPQKQYAGIPRLTTGGASRGTPQHAYAIRPSEDDRR